MIAVGAGARVMVATRPVDFRKGMDGLAALVQAEMRNNPFSGVIYVFRAKRAQLSTFCIWFSFCDDCVSLASAVWADVAGLTISSRQSANVHLHRRATGSLPRAP